MSLFHGKFCADRVARSYTRAVVEVLVSETQVRLELTGWDRLWALKNNLVFPVEGVRSVYAEPDPQPPWREEPLAWMRAGVSVPYVVQAGTFTKRGAREFWCIHYTGRGVVFELDGLFYTRIVVDVRDPEAVVQRVRAARWGRPEVGV